MTYISSNVRTKYSEQLQLSVVSWFNENWVARDGIIYRMCEKLCPGGGIALVCNLQPNCGMPERR